MDMNTSRCWAEIDLEALSENCRRLHRILPPGCRLMNILKADAYGHGAVQVAKALSREFPEDWMGVACLSEALELRQAGIRQDLLILGYTPPEAAPILAAEHITQALISPEYTAGLAAKASEAGVVVLCHVKLDTGMTRIGYPCQVSTLWETIEAVAAAYRMPSLRVGGIFTHFSSAYEHKPEDEAYTERQFERFSQVCHALEMRGIHPGLRHCCNSPATLNRPEYAMDMCRAGTVLYGLLPDTAMLHPMAFCPVLTWKARVAMVRQVSAGTSVSYSRLAVTERDTLLAVITAGDADGYPRRLTNLGRVCIQGHVCPVVGRVCMDMFMVDVTDCPDVAEGDEAVLLGDSGENVVPCQWLYKPLGLGPSSITCNIRARVPRVYKGI